MNQTFDSMMSAIGLKRVKQKRCKVCKSKFAPRSSTQKVCSPDCALVLLRQTEEKLGRTKKTEERKADRAKRERLKTRSDWAREAQAAVNSYVRERDHGLPCISCGRFHQGSWDAGHYRSVGAAPGLRFDLANIHRQCVPCNQHKSGNAIEYRIGLVKRIGLSEVERLESDNEPKKWTVEELRSIRDEYRGKLKSMKENRQNNGLGYDE